MGGGERSENISEKMLPGLFSLPRVRSRELATAMNVCKNVFILHLYWLDDF